MPRRLVRVLVAAFTPIRRDNLAESWPLALTAACAACAILALARPDTFHAGRAGWVAAAVFLAALQLLRAAYVLYGEAHPAFPSHRLSFGQPWHARVDAHRNYVVLDVEFTNRDRHRTVVLDVRPRWEVVHTRQKFDYDLHIARGSGFKDELVLPVKVEPMRTASGKLILDADVACFVTSDAEPHRFAVRIRRGWRCYVEIEDQMSGGTIIRPLPFVEAAAS